MAINPRNVRKGPVTVGHLPIGEVLEKDRIRHQAGHSNDAPTRRRPEHIVETPEIGDAVGGNAETREPAEKLTARAVGEHFLLAMKQSAPDRMLLGSIVIPVLLDGRDAGHVRILSARMRSNSRSLAATRPKMLSGG